MRIFIENYFKIGLTILLIVLLVALNRNMTGMDLSITSVKLYLESKGNLAPLFYIILFTIVPLTLFPDAFLVIACGMVFGFYKGFIYTVIGAACGATLSFYLARYFGAGLVNKFNSHKLIKFDQTFKKNGFLIIFALRLIPLFPFDLISYSAGFSKVQYRPFILATIIGAIPGMMVYVNLGDKFLNIGSNSFYLAIMALVLLVVFSAIFKKSKSFKNIINMNE